MNPLLRASLLALPIALLAACSSGGDNTDGAILDIDDLPTGPNSISIKLSCPASISPGTTLRGLTASFTDQAQQPIANAFVALSAATGVISAPPGVPNSGGDTTDAFGLVEFDYAISDAVPLNSRVIIKAEVNYLGTRVTKSCSLLVKNSNFVITQPLDDSSLIVGVGNAIPVQLQWTDDKGDGVAGSVRLSTTTGGILVTPTGNATAATTATNANGELDGTTLFACTRRGTATLRAEELGNTARSSSVTVNCLEAPLYLDVTVSNDDVNPAPDNNRFSTFTIRPVSNDNANIPNLPITVELITPAGGGDRILAPSVTTNEAGNAASRYEAGTAPGQAEIRFCVRASPICTTRLVRVRGGATSGTGASLALVCPSGVNVGATSDVGTATLSDSAGRGIGNNLVNLSPGRGFINAPPDQGSSFGGNTGSDGRLLFTYTAPTDIRVDTTVGVRGTSNVNGTNLTASCSLLVRADLFQLTAPADNTEQALGTAAARNVSLIWQNGNRIGVVGPVVISATNNAKLTTDINNTGAQQITLNTTSSGALESSLFFICTQPGPVEIKAVDQASFSKTASVTVQCIDPPSSLTARATPTLLNRDPSNNRFAEATFTLFGQGGSNVRNADLVFTLVSQAGGGDRLLNTSGVTDEGGSAIARYEAGTSAGSTVIQGCLRNSSICERITLTVQ